MVSGRTSTTRPASLFEDIVMSAIDDVLRRKAAIDVGCYYEGGPTEEDLRTAINHVSGYGDEFSWPFDAQASRGSERDFMVETAALLLPLSDGSQ